MSLSDSDLINFSALLWCCFLCCAVCHWLGSWLNFLIQHWHWFITACLICWVQLNYGEASPFNGLPWFVATLFVVITFCIFFICLLSTFYFALHFHFLMAFCVLQPFFWHCLLSWLFARFSLVHCLLVPLYFLCFLQHSLSLPLFENCSKGKGFLDFSFGILCSGTELPLILSRAGMVWGLLGAPKLS